MDGEPEQSRGCKGLHCGGEGGRSHRTNVGHVANNMKCRNLSSAIAELSEPTDQALDYEVDVIAIDTREHNVDVRPRLDDVSAHAHQCSSIVTRQGRELVQAVGEPF